MASSAGYLLKYDLRDFLFFNDVPDMVDKINNLDKGLVLELEIDEFSAFKGIKNWEDLRDQAYKMLDDIRINGELKKLR